MFDREKANKMQSDGMTDSSPESREHTTENGQSVRGKESLVECQEVSRRTLLKGGGALAGLTVLRVAGPAHAFPGHFGEWKGEDDRSNTPRGFGDPEEKVIPWLDQPVPNPFPDNLKNLLKWEELDSWLTPTDKFFSFNHFGQPASLNEATWHVDIAGLVARPQSLM